MNRIQNIDPFADLFPQVLRGFVQPSRSRGNSTATRSASMPLDVSETEASYVVQAEIPGVSKDQIEVEIDGDRVSISAQIKRATEQKEGERLVRNERYEGKVARTIAFGNEIEEDSATASYENGVLELTLPKKVVAGARRLAIS